MNRLAQTLDKLASQFSEYLRLVGETLLSENPAKYSECESAVQSLSESAGVIQRSESLLETSGRELLQGASELSSRIAQTRSLVRTLASVVEDPRLYSRTFFSMSSTYTINIGLTRASIQSNSREYLSSDESEFTEKILRRFDVAKNKTTGVEFAMSASANPFTTSLICALLQIATPVDRRCLVEIVERQKDSLLGAARVDFAEYSELVAFCGQISLGSLVPQTESMPLDSLLRLALGKPPRLCSATLGTRETLVDFCRDSGLGVILLTSATLSPVEFNLRGFLDAAYIAENNLSLGTSTGLTKRVLKKLDTTRRLDRANAPETRIERFHSDPFPRKWIVLETLNLSLFRALGEPAGSKLDGRSEIILDYARVLSLTSLSTRPDRYNRTQERLILSRCFVSSHTLLVNNYAHMRESDMSYQPLAEKLRVKLLETLSVHGIRQGKIAEAVQSLLCEATANPEIMLSRLSIVDSFSRFVYAELLKVSRETPGAGFGDLVDSVLASLEKNSVWDTLHVTLKEYFLSR